MWFLTISDYLLALLPIAASKITKASGTKGVTGLLSHVYAASKYFAKSVLETFPKASVCAQGGPLLTKAIVSGVLLFRGRDKLYTLYKVQKTPRTLNNNKTEDI